MPSTERDVSPVGTSRFERPYSPPQSIASTAVNSPTTPANNSTYRFNFSKPSRENTHHSTSTAPTSPSDDLLFKETNHYSTSTAQTSLHDDFLCKEVGVESCALYDDPDCQTCPDSEDLDRWSSRMDSNVELPLEVNDRRPDRETLASAYDVPIYDATGKGRAFGSLYDPNYAPHQRQLIIFVRYFYCPACKAYIQALTRSIPMHEYFSIPIPTSIIIIGCGQPDLIPQYQRFTNCQYPIFVDPSRQLYKKLGMSVTWKIGKQRPEYMTNSIWAASGEQLVTLKKSLNDPDGIRKRDLLRGGNLAQVGGEFLFENGQAVWCHRMTTYRNHTEMREVRKLLNLDG